MTNEFIGSAIHDVEIVKVPDGTETIPMDAFARCETLKEITIPGSVEAIESRAFFGCKHLSNVSIFNRSGKGSFLKRIYYHAFERCTSLTEVVIPRSVEEIFSHAFEGCTSLVDVYLLGDDTWVSEYAFTHSDSLMIHCKQDSPTFTNLKNAGYTNICADIV